MPEASKSSYLTGDVGYDMYLREAHRQVSSLCVGAGACVPKHNNVNNAHLFIKTKALLPFTIMLPSSNHQSLFASTCLLANVGTPSAFM